jgi:hypothetical protein
LSVVAEEEPSYLALIDLSCMQNDDCCGAVECDPEYIDAFYCTVVL